MKTDSPLVSICCITYNHQAYIKDALNGFKNQKTDFPVEIIISDDNSTDGTQAIIVSQISQYNDSILFLSHDQNLRAVRNFILTIQACNGKYIALCEGDDYWIDPYKLQKQVDFLEAHPNCTSCFHDVNYQYENGEIKPSPYKNSVEKDIYSIEDLLVKDVWTKTCSCMFVNGLINQRLNLLDDLSIGDWPLFVLLAEKGDIGYIHEVMGVYRVHSDSLFSTIGLEKQLLAILDSRIKVNRYLNFKYKNLLMPEIYKYSYQLANYYFSQGEKKKARIYYRRCIRLQQYHQKHSRYELCKKYFQAIFPDSHTIGI